MFGLGPYLDLTILHLAVIPGYLSPVFIFSRAKYVVLSLKVLPSLFFQECLTVLLVLVFITRNTHTDKGRRNNSANISMWEGVCVCRVFPLPQI